MKLTDKQIKEIEELTGFERTPWALSWEYDFSKVIVEGEKSEFLVITHKGEIIFELGTMEFGVFRILELDKPKELIDGIKKIIGGQND